MKTYQGVNHQNICITNGFWKNRQDINASITSHAVYNRFSDSHRFEALDCNWNERMSYRPHIFWDSDVAKWLEGAAYIIHHTKDTHLEALCEKAIQTIIKNQTPEGYFNSYFLVLRQNERFKHRNDHELYCAGHLMEAACAYYEATGKNAFLKAMCKYADYIYDTFYIYQTPSFVTSGHPEIELALVRLYETTGNEKYLELSKHFIDKRGNNPKDQDIAKDYNKYNTQDHLPLVEQRTAEGHSVRALYIYSAMSDIARTFDHDGYFEACEAIFENIISKRMYITGGVGSSSMGESFATDYFLPNDTAYTETCAAIALALFCKRMQRISNNSKYADIAERVIYNGFLSGVSLDGKAFFYENPLEINPAYHDVNTSSTKKRHMPIMQRLELFGCSCCPPNVLRFIASIGDLLYTHDEKTLFMHQFMNSDATIKNTQVCQTTAYPVDGALKITMEGNDFEEIAIRIPGWCQNFTADASYTLENGYAYFQAAPEINICFEMNVQLYQSNPAVQNNAGCVAVARGPVIYCLEEIDNGANLHSLNLDSNADFMLEFTKDYQVPVLHTEGYRTKAGAGLYSFYDGTMEKTALHFIPYFAFANRGVSEMLVWIPVLRNI